LFGGLALICSLLLWITSQEPVRRRFYNIYKPLHHIGFWGFMLMGVAHKWSLFWYFVPGMLLYAVDGVFRLYQVSAGRSGSLARGLDDAAGAAGERVGPQAPSL
jgi:DMSO/TMAO reductase YedYZ heme-binding membrane subunit